MKGKAIPVKCAVAESCRLEELQPFQGTLKTLTEEHFDKLRKSIERYGIRFPIYYWQSNGSKFTLDGHQRVRVLEAMIEDGWKLPDGKVPVVAVEAKDEREAKEMVLLATAQYARIGPEGLYEFLHTSSINFDDIKDAIELPNIDMKAFEFGWMSDSPAQFDASKVEGAVSGDTGEACIVYLSFSSHEQFMQALDVLTFGEGSSSRQRGKQATLNGDALLERWKEAMRHEG